MRKSRRAEAAASAGSRCGVELAPSSSFRSSLRPRSAVLARLLPTQPSAAAELSPDRWRQAPPPPTPNHEQELPGARRARVGAETQPGPEENGEGGGGGLAPARSGGGGTARGRRPPDQTCRGRPLRVRRGPSPSRARSAAAAAAALPLAAPAGVPRWRGGRDPAGLSPPARKGRRGLGRLRPVRARCPGVRVRPVSPARPPAHDPAGLAGPALPERPGRG